MSDNAIRSVERSGNASAIEQWNLRRGIVPDFRTLLARPSAESGGFNARTIPTERVQELYRALMLGASIVR